MGGLVLRSTRTGVHGAVTERKNRLVWETVSSARAGQRIADIVGFVLSRQGRVQDMDLGLGDKVAVVTGGSRGLGRAICLGLAAEGAKVAINYHRHGDKASEVADRIRADHGTDAVPVQGDVAEQADVSRLFDEAEAALGPLDILINNAGV
ncbi:MAG: SDR family NAD(P)-dependent oxidoreductase, partial [bacterium]|nr:SDR family NAD(P)-dependent oxidoreductase [bacterium]